MGNLIMHDWQVVHACVYHWFVRLTCKSSYWGSHLKPVRRCQGLWHYELQPLEVGDKPQGLYRPLNSHSWRRTIERFERWARTSANGSLRLYCDKWSELWFSRSCVFERLWTQYQMEIWRLGFSMWDEMEKDLLLLLFVKSHTICKKERRKHDLFKGLHSKGLTFLGVH